jgi:hypothetical protein
LNVTAYLGRYGDKVYIPAWRAHDALQGICNCAFPFDSEESQKVWGSVQSLPETQRSQVLSKLFPMAEPITAVLCESRKNSNVPLQLQVRLTNTSTQQVEISGDPEIDICYRSASGSGGVSGGRIVSPVSTSGFFTLQPSESLIVSINGELLPQFLGTKPIDRGLKMFFLKLNPTKREGVRSWMGVVRAQ